MEIEEYSNGNLINTETLSRINGKDEGLVREEGIFVDAPNVLYKYEKHLNQDNIYKLQVTNTGSRHVASAETEIVHNFEFDVLLNPTNVHPFQVINFVSSTPRLIQYRLPTNSTFMISTSFSIIEKRMWKIRLFMKINSLHLPLKMKR